MMDRELIDRLIRNFNVSRVRGEELEERGGAFGLLLRLVQQRKVRRPVFEETLKRVVRALEDQLTAADRNRWLALLSYLGALIYYERDEPEHEPMQRLVVDSVRNDVRRREVHDMGKSMAEALKDEGRAEEAVRSRRETLLEQLGTKFGAIPAGVRRRIETTDDVAQLKAWLKALVKARRLSNVGIAPLE